MKYTRGTMVEFLHDGKRWVGKIITYWADNVHYDITCPELPNTATNKIPEDAIIRCVSPEKVYVVNWVEDSCPKDSFIYGNEWLAKNKVNEILTEIAKESTPNLHIALHDTNVGFNYEGAKCSTYGYVELIEKPIIYDE